MFLLYHAYVYLEFLILACTIYILAPVTLRVLEENGKKEELKLVTFDKKMYEFSKKNNVMYDEEIYNKFLTEIQ